MWYLSVSIEMWLKKNIYIYDWKLYEWTKESSVVLNIADVLIIEYTTENYMKERKIAM